MTRVVPQKFFARDAISVARDLIGFTLLHRLPDGTEVGGTIAETEAYCGVADRACHAFGYRRTGRTEPMYGPPGTAYVYLIYGVHHCLNLVTLREGNPQAVLVRSLVPSTGLASMAERRQQPALVGSRPNPELTNGPGKLCQALGVDRSFNGVCFARGPLYIGKGPRAGKLRKQTQKSSRVGLGQVGEFALFPWRFSLKEEVLEKLLCQIDVDCTSV